MPTIKVLSETIKGTDVNGDPFDHKAGDVVDVSEAFARAFLENGAAELATAKSEKPKTEARVERAVVTPTETRGAE